MFSSLVSSDGHLLSFHGEERTQLLNAICKLTPEAAWKEGQFIATTDTMLEERDDQHKDKRIIWKKLNTAWFEFCNSDRQFDLWTLTSLVLLQDISVFQAYWEAFWISINDACQKHGHNQQTSGQKRLPLYIFSELCWQPAHPLVLFFAFFFSVYKSRRRSYFLEFFVRFASNLMEKNLVKNVLDWSNETFMWLERCAGIKLLIGGHLR